MIRTSLRPATTTLPTSARHGAACAAARPASASARRRAIAPPTWCWRHAHPLDRAVARRSLRVAVVVGTILVLINQSGALLHGHLTTVVATRIALVYLVPFAVASYSALQATRLPQSGGHGASGTVPAPPQMSSVASDFAVESTQENDG